MLLGKVVFIAAIIIQVIIRYHYKEGTKRKLPDREEQVLLALFSVGGMILPLIYVFTDWLNSANYSSSSWLLGTGCLIEVMSLWAFWRSHKDLGHNWSPSLELQQDHTLVTHGVYRRVRHPMYTSGWLMVMAQALLLNNWVAGFSGLVTYGLMYFSRVPREEQMMLEEFGEQYREYMSRTGRILPRR